MSVADKVKSAIAPVVDGLGYIVYDVTYKKEADGMNLTVYIECKSGEQITVDDCEKVSHAIDELVDELTPPEPAFNLNVASLGLDYPITGERDFVRNKGKLVEVSLYAKQDGKKDFVGRLESWTDKEITITIYSRGEYHSPVVLKRDTISHIAPHITF